LSTDLIEDDFTVAVSFPYSARPEDYRCNHLHLGVGDECIADTENGPALGTVARARMKVKGRRCCHRLRNIIRKATEEDLKISYRIRQKEKEAYQAARRAIEEYELDMKLNHLEITWDEKRAIVFFTSEDRVDFRDMVKSIASHLKLKIEMRQIGARDEARMLGGAGICGCKLCCSSFLKEFAPVSIRMAKDQGLSLNPSKISGVCGRLMCCLNYEDKYYREMHKIVPRVGKTVITPSGKGKVINADYLRERVTVDLGDDGRETFQASEVTTGQRDQKKKQPSGDQKKKQPSGDRKGKGRGRGNGRKEAGSDS